MSLGAALKRDLKGNIMGLVLNLDDWQEEPIEKLFVEEFFIPCDNILLSDLFEKVAKIKSQFSDEFFITANCGEALHIQVFRNETYEEYVERVTSEEQYRKLIQEKADNSWKRQKRKFKKARQ